MNSKASRPPVITDFPWESKREKKLFKCMKMCLRWRDKKDQFISGDSITSCQPRLMVSQMHLHISSSVGSDFVSDHGKRHVKTNEVCYTCADSQCSEQRCWWLTALLCALPLIEHVLQSLSQNAHGPLLPPHMMSSDEFGTPHLLSLLQSLTLGLRTIKRWKDIIKLSGCINFARPDALNRYWQIIWFIVPIAYIYYNTY